MSRRQALTAVAIAALAGVSTDSAEVHAAQQGAVSTVGLAPSPAHAAEFSARFFQTGPSGTEFSGAGYLTRLAGIDDDALFAAGAQRNETTALFTAYATGQLVQRNFGQSVHALDIEGVMTIYQRSSPGATFDSLDSFQLGSVVAEFDLTLQDVLSVILPGKGIPTLTGAMQQSASNRLAAPFPPRHFGRRGSSGRLFATGLGTLVDPIAPNSNLEMAGNWVID